MVSFQLYKKVVAIGVLASPPALFILLTTPNRPPLYSNTCAQSNPAHSTSRPRLEDAQIGGATLEQSAILQLEWPRTGDIVVGAALIVVHSRLMKQGVCRGAETRRVSKPCRMEERRGVDRGGFTAGFLVHSSHSFI